MKYIHELGPLFEAVQMNNIFPDGKTFPDCLPKFSLQEIKETYEQEKEQTGFDLKAFVHNNFDAPPSFSTNYESSASRTAEEHIHALWDVLTRQPDEEKGSSLIPLPHPYIVPGGRFREVYYWDSYFSMLGLRTSGRFDLIENMLDNFAYLIDQFGFIPNGNRAYYLGRSQPPFFALMVQLLYKEKGAEILIKYLPQLEKEHSFWMNGAEGLNDENIAINRVVKLPEGEILNRYWDKYDTPRPESYKEDVELAHNSKQAPEKVFRHLRAAAESGWDFSHRWFEDENDFGTIHTTEIVPVDLNCLLYFLEKLIAKAYKKQDNKDNKKHFNKLAKQRKKAILKYCWNKKSSFFYDYDFIKSEQKPYMTLAATFPLFFKIARQKQVDKVANLLKDKFLQPGGLSTTLAQTGQQWDAPNGWAPLQWMAYKGLKNYEINDLAEEVKQRWLNVNLKVYEKTGKMTEKYDVINNDLEASGGEYPNQDGFGWTNGVFLAMLSKKH